MFAKITKTPWRNGSASDSRSEGCVFESRRGHVFSHNFEFWKFYFSHRIGSTDGDFCTDIEIEFILKFHHEYGNF